MCNNIDSTLDLNVMSPAVAIIEYLLNLTIHLLLAGMNLEIQVVKCNGILYMLHTVVFRQLVQQS